MVSIPGENCLNNDGTMDPTLCAREAGSCSLFFRSSLDKTSAKCVLVGWKWGLYTCSAHGSYRGQSGPLGSLATTVGTTVIVLLQSHNKSRTIKNTARFYR